MDSSPKPGAGAVSWYSIVQIKFNDRRMQGGRVKWRRENCGSGRDLCGEIICRRMQVCRYDHTTVRVSTPRTLLDVDDFAAFHLRTER